MENSKPRVPLIQQDVSHEETVLQIAFALDSLQIIANKVFNDVEGRINSQKLRLTEIQKRCLRAKEKVQRLKGINKSITVYSSAKYPVPEQDLFFEGFNHFVKIERPDIKIKHTPLPPNKMTLKEKMKFYHVKDSTQMLRRNDEIDPIQGLGPIPESINSINSLLLYNTSHNIYDKYKLINSLDVNKQLTLVDSKKVNIQLEPPPVSISERLGPKIIPNYFYTAISQDVPDIQVPIDLPNLPGIANDLRYDENEPLEIIVEESIEVKRPVISEDTITIVQELPKIEYSDRSKVAPPIPPPPPPPPIPEPDPLPALEVKMNAPPPPPIPSSNDNGKLPAMPLIDSSSDMRANLMDAIRKAGGKANLKSVCKEKENIPDKSAPMSLMEDLHNKLLMRRKGILGKTENNEGNILEQIATMIPPPPLKQQDSEEDGNEEEWND